MVLLRHGESVWNEEDRFTGWTDIDLSERGIFEAKQAGKILQEKKYFFDVAFTSVLKRAIRTLWLVLDEMNLMWIPEYHSWRFNERHYGALQGLNKTQLAMKVGEEQVRIWRRSYDVRPPALKETEKRILENDAKYKDLRVSEIPLTESLKDTVARCIPYWQNTIAPTLKSGKHVLVAAHGNSLRALVKYLDNINDMDIINTEIPTGIPLVYEFNALLKPLDHYYLEDADKIKEATSSVTGQRKVS